MKNELKIIRFGIISTIFIAFIILQGIAEREANQVIFMLMIISLFSLFLKNIWATLFLLWTVFLFMFFHFSTGSVYLSNVLFGSMLYIFTKNCFKREHIDLYINAFLWFVCANLFYSVIQLIGCDFVFTHTIWDGFIFQKAQVNRIAGFMGHESIISTLLAFSVPILASRGTKLAWTAAFLMLIPLYLCTTALCLVAGVVGLLFILFFKVRRIVWVGCVVILLIFSLFYVSKVDKFGTERFKQWHRSMSDYMKHPITGWGLDSFGNITPNKDFLYPQTKYHRDEWDVKGQKMKNVTAIMWWDNPHNLIISLLYEFGFPGLFLVFMYLRRSTFNFIEATKTPNTLGLAGLGLLFILISMGHFPIYLARLAPIVICSFALLEVSTG